MKKWLPKQVSWGRERLLPGSPPAGKVVCYVRLPSKTTTGVKSRRSRKPVLRCVATEGVRLGAPRGLGIGGRTTRHRSAPVEGLTLLQEKAGTCRLVGRRVLNEATLCREIQARERERRAAQATNR